MTDESMANLVSKHDALLGSLVSSVEHLITSQTETNKKLEDVATLLSKQVIISSKIETMDRELVDSFRRVHKRIDAVERIQVNDSGCNSVKLLAKDVESNSKNITRLIGDVEEHRIEVDNMKSSSISPQVIRWTAGLIIAYSIMFGTFVVTTLTELSKTDVRLIEMLHSTSTSIKELKVKIIK